MMTCLCNLKLKSQLCRNFHNQISINAFVNETWGLYRLLRTSVITYFKNNLPHIVLKLNVICPEQTGYFLKLRDYFLISDTFHKTFQSLLRVYSLFYGT